MVITAQNIHQKPGYKQTEVGVIPVDWELVKIGDYAYVTKLAGFEYTNHFDYRKSGPIIVIRALNIKDGKLDLSDVHTIPNETSKLLPRSQLAKGDLVISYVGTLGRVAVVPEDGKFHLAPNVAKIRTNPGQVDPFYLSQSLNGEIGQQAIFKVAASTTQAALSMQNLREVTFILPPLPEQRAIATALSDVDALITSLDQLIAKKRDIKLATMQQLLTGKTRLPGFSGEWKVKKVEEIAPFQRGFDLPTSQLKAGVYPVVYSNGVLNHHSSFKVKAPGVVTGRSGTIGKVHYIEDDYWPHNTTLWVTDFKGNLPKFIYYLYINIKLERFGTGSGVPTMNRNDVHTYQVPIPSFLEQQAIADILTDMDAEIAALERKRDKTRALKQGMMQELLTGKTRLI